MTQTPSIPESVQAEAERIYERIKEPLGLEITEKEMIAQRVAIIATALMAQRQAALEEAALIADKDDWCPHSIVNQIRALITTPAQRQAATPAAMRSAEEWSQEIGEKCFLGVEGIASVFRTSLCTDIVTAIQAEALAAAPPPPKGGTDD